jgi:hypothetical protein
VVTSVTTCDVPLNMDVCNADEFRRKTERIVVGMPKIWGDLAAELEEDLKVFETKPTPIPDMMSQPSIMSDRRSKRGSVQSTPKAKPKPKPSA